MIWLFCVLKVIIYIHVGIIWDMSLYLFLSDNDNQLLHVSVLKAYEKRRRMLGGMWATTDYEYPIPRSKVTSQFIHDIDVRTFVMSIIFQ